jgi:adenylate kinase family enzyme
MADIKQGKSLLDEQIIKLLEKRISLADCKKNGWVLDGMPLNKNQAELLNRKNIIPTSVFLLTLTDL